MLSKIPVNLEKIKRDKLLMEVLRTAIIAELDAVNLYEQMAELVGDETAKKALLDIAEEEKVHVGEFQALLLKVDKEQAKALERGKEEVEGFRQDDLNSK